MTQRIWLALILTLFFTPLARGDEPNRPASEPPLAERFLGKRAPISLNEAVRLALENNLDLEIARTDPLIADAGVDAARGVFDPELFGEYLAERREILQANALQGTRIDDEDARRYAGGLTGLLPFGLSYSSEVSQRYLSSESQVTLLDPEWRAQWRNEVVLPLLRDFLNNPQNVEVKRSRVARDISHEDFRSQLTDLVVRVEGSYWELAAARAEERVTEKSLQTAQDLLEQTRVQYEVGVVSKVNVTQAVAGVAEREVDHIVASNRADRAQDDLLNVLLAPGSAEFASTELEPQDPAYVDYEANLDAALERALDLRPEIVAARKALEDAELQLTLAENQRLPSLDLLGAVQVDGLSGSGKPGSETLFGTPGPNLGDSEDAFDDFLRKDGAQNWLVGANFSIPIGNRTARAVEIQRRIELRRAKASLKREEQGVILDVRDAVRSLANAREALEAAERRRIAQEETLEAEQERLRLGDSTPFQVLEFEEDLAEARRQQILALQQYRNSITALERGQATLLDRRGISVASEIER